MMHQQVEIHSIGMYSTMTSVQIWWITVRSSKVNSSQWKKIKINNEQPAQKVI